MTEMDERVARAIIARMSELSGLDETFDNIPVEDLEDALSVARAAIAAMRESTPEMIAAMVGTNSAAAQPNKYRFDYDIHARCEWQAAIDAALKHASDGVERMSEMDERVARAIGSVAYLPVMEEFRQRYYKECHAWIDDKAPGDPPKLDEVAVQAEWHRRQAIAAIAAMREPTPEMIAAGTAYKDGTPDDDYAEDVKAIFQAMLDVALKPSPPMVKLDREPADNQQERPDNARGGFED